MGPGPAAAGGNEGESRRGGHPADGAASRGELPLLPHGYRRAVAAGGDPLLLRAERGRRRLRRGPEHLGRLRDRPGPFCRPCAVGAVPCRDDAAGGRDLPGEDLRGSGGRRGLPGAAGEVLEGDPGAARGDPEGILRALPARPGLPGVTSYFLQAAASASWTWRTGTRE